MWRWRLYALPVPSDVRPITQNVQSRVEAPRNHPNLYPGQADAATHLRGPSSAIDDMGAPSEAKRAYVGCDSSTGTKHRRLNESFSPMPLGIDPCAIPSSPYAARALAKNFLTGKQPTDSLPSVDGTLIAAMQPWCRVEPIPSSCRPEPLGMTAHPPRHGIPGTEQRFPALSQQISHPNMGYGPPTTPNLEKRLPPPLCGDFQGPRQLREFAMWKPGLQTTTVPQSASVDTSQAQVLNTAPGNTSLDPHSSKSREQSWDTRKEADNVKARKLMLNTSSSCGQRPYPTLRQTASQSTMLPAHPTSPMKHLTPSSNCGNTSQMLRGKCH